MPTRRAQESRLLREIKTLRELAFPAKHPDEVADEVTVTMLEEERNAVVRGRVLTDCAFVEEAMVLLLMHHFLDADTVFRRLRYFGRNRKFMLLNDALDRVSANLKISFVKRAIDIPKSIEKVIERMFKLRNVLAHVGTLNPNSDRLRYQGHRVLSLKGFAVYRAETLTVMAWLAERISSEHARLKRKEARETRRAKRGATREER